MKHFSKTALSWLLVVFVLFSGFVNDCAEIKASAASGRLISYSGHVESYGNINAVSDGATLGITGEGKRLEAIKINKGSGLSDIAGDIVYRVHIQNIGNQDWVKNGAMAGTEGRGLRIEAIQIYLTGDLAEKYDIYYKVHIQNYGWMDWTKGSASESGWAGTTGKGLRVEAIQIKMISKTYEISNVNTSSNTASTDAADISYSGHQETYGDIDTVSDGAILGVTGQAKRLEALKINLDIGDDCSGSVLYRSHVQDIGWQEWVSDGELTGTTGQGKRLEAIQIKLIGDVSEKYDVYYRLHIQNKGWLGWAKNGQSSGSSGLGYRAEAIQIKLVSKGGAAPGSTSNYYVTGPQIVAKSTLISAINNAGTSKTLTTIGSNYNLSSAAGIKLNSAINAYNATGKSIGILMIDLSTGMGVQYNSGQTFFGASTIKGPYVAAINKYYPDSTGAYSDVMYQTITVSSNSDYTKLRTVFGSTPMQNMIDYSGATEISGSTQWPSYNCKTLSKLWVGNYWYFFMETNSKSAYCRSLYTNSKMSFIKDTLGSKYTVYTKPGWMTIPPTYAHNDAGIIISGSYPYIICILSNGYGYEAYLNNIVSALDEVHSDMVK